MVIVVTVTLGMGKGNTESSDCSESGDVWEGNCSNSDTIQQCFQYLQPTNLTTLELGQH